MQAASYEEQQAKSTDHEILIPTERPVATKKFDQKSAALFENENFQTLPGGYLFPQRGGRCYNNRWYTEHALERMAPATPEIMRLLEARASASRGVGI